MRDQWTNECSKVILDLFTMLYVQCKYGWFCFYASYLYLVKNNSDCFHCMTIPVIIISINYRHCYLLNNHLDYSLSKGSSICYEIWKLFMFVTLIAIVICRKRLMGYCRHGHTTLWMWWLENVVTWGQYFFPSDDINDMS